MSINTHGLKMVGLRKAAGATKGLQGYYSAQYVQLSYNTRTGEVLTVFHSSLGQNSWNVYNNSDIIGIGNISSPMTMQNIADKIAKAVARQKFGY